MLASADNTAPRTAIVGMSISAVLTEPPCVPVIIILPSEPPEEEAYAPVEVGVRTQLWEEEAPARMLEERAFPAVCELMAEERLLMEALAPVIEEFPVFWTVTVSWRLALAVVVS